MSEIKFPPVPEWIGRVAHDRTGQGPRIWADADVLDYARAAVALNAPAWRKTADDPPPDDATEVLTLDRDGYRDIAYGATVNNNPDFFRFWMEMPAGPEAA